MTIAELSDYYANLLAQQYRGLPRASAQVRLFTKQAWCDLLAQAVGSAFDLDTAIGTQLDVLGKYIGVSRLQDDPASKPYFGFHETEGGGNWLGMRSTTDPAINANVIWYSVGDAQLNPTALTDAQYRLLLNLKIACNICDETLYSIQNLLHELLPGLVALVDHKDMTMTYTVTQSVPISPTILVKFLPRPMAVGVSLDIVTAVAAPDTLSKSISVGSPGFWTVTTDAPSEVDVTGGTAPYSYTWQKLSETFPYGMGMVATTPDAADTTFSETVDITYLEVWDSVAVWQCIVTDANGVYIASNSVTVTLHIEGPIPP